VLSYDLLSELPLKHRSHNHNNSLSELLLTISLINISSITRTRQTKHIKNKAEAITIAKVFREALKAAVTSEAVTVSKEVTAVADISYYLHNKRSVIFTTNQVAGQQNTLLKSRSKHTTSSANTSPVFIRNPQLYIIKAF
jgi:UDP-N-acetylglucosamine:LPS N-acetylglucosamine transferase